MSTGRANIESGSDAAGFAVPPDRACRGCGATGLRPVLDLGETPLANSLLTPDQLGVPEPTFPLSVVLCPACTLAQIPDVVPPERMFSNYLYFSSFSDTMLRHAKAHADELVAGRRLGPDSLVVEIASNDGYLLKNFVAAGVPVLGVEPAKNVAEVATANGVRTVSEFFGRELAADLKAKGFAADVVLANNVMAHVPDINGVLAGVKVLLKPGGVFVMETPYVKDLLDNLEFDTVYHEHVFYHSLTALENLYRRHGLTAVDVEHLPIHGGSLRVSVAHAGTRASPAVGALLDEEAAWGVADASGAYATFARKVLALRGQLRALLAGLKADGKSVAAYGASAKGSTLLNFFGIGRETLDFVVDRSTHKQGRLTPGTHLPISPPERLLAEQPDYCLLLTWNFADEILAQQAEYRRRGGSFVVPIPEPRVVPPPAAAAAGGRP